jgi:hypothetical protein
MVLPRCQEDGKVVVDKVQNQNDNQIDDGSAGARNNRGCRFDFGL